MWHTSGGQKRLFVAVSPSTLRLSVPLSPCASLFGEDRRLLLENQPHGGDEQWTHGVAALV